MGERGEGQRTGRKREGEKAERLSFVSMPVQSKASDM
jgi:hypothetical protein